MNSQHHELDKTSLSDNEEGFPSACLPVLPVVSTLSVVPFNADTANAYKKAASFKAAMEQNLLYDVSALAQQYGLNLPTQITQELWQDIASRMPGELGGMGAEDRLAIVVAQAVTTMVCSTGNILMSEVSSFGEAVAAKEPIAWNMELALLAETKDHRESAAPRRALSGFAPYKVWASLEYDSAGHFGLVLALQYPFSPTVKSTP